MRKAVNITDDDLALLEVLDDPVFFGEFVRSGETELEVDMGWSFDNYQKRMLLDKNHYLSVCTGRSTGKTVSMETRIIFDAVSNKYKNASDNEILLVVQNKAQLEPVFLRLVTFFRRNHLLKNFVDRLSVNFGEHLIKLLNGATIRCRIVGASADSNVIGLHVPCIYVDEGQVFSYLAWNSLQQCFPAGTKVATPSGYKNIEAIGVGDIIFSFKEKGHKKILEQKVLNVIKKPLNDNVLKIETACGSVVCTDTHEFLTYRKGNSKVYKPASSLSIGDRVTKLIDMSNFGTLVDDIVYGDMCAQKREHLSDLQVNHAYGIKTVSDSWLDNLTVAGIACWYMDDGSINAGDFVSIRTFGFSYKEQVLLVSKLDEFGFIFDIRTNKGKQHYLVCKNPETFLLATMPYAVESMQYKFRLPMSKDILNIKSIGITDEFVYDLEVEGVHNYIADNFVVHNCLTTWDDDFTLWVSGVPNGLREKNVLFECDNDIKFSTHRVSRLNNKRYTEEQNGSDLRQYGGEQGDDYVHLVLGEHGSPAFSVFDRKLMRIEDYPVTLSLINNLSLEAVQGKFHEILNAPELTVEHDLVCAGIDAGFSNDPTIITILYRHKDVWREFARYELRRIKYPTQAKIINWLDNIYRFNMIAMDAGHSGLALGQWLQDDDEYIHKNFASRLIMVDFQGSVVTGYDEEGKDIKDRIRKFTIQTLQKWSQNDQMIAFSIQDEEVISELERVGFTRDMLGQPKFFVYSAQGGQRGDDHILASLLCWVYGYYYEYYSPERPIIKGKYSDLAGGGWNLS